VGAVLVVGSADGGDCADAGTVHVLVVLLLLPLVLIHLRTSTDQADASSIPPTLSKGLRKDPRCAWTCASRSSRRVRSRDDCIGQVCYSQPCRSSRRVGNSRVESI